jgi:hypothetical protein
MGEPLPCHPHQQPLRVPQPVGGSMMGWGFGADMTFLVAQGGDRKAVVLGLNSRSDLARLRGFAPGKSDFGPVSVR